MNILTEILHLSGVRIYKTFKKDNNIVLRVCSTCKKIPCTSCGAIFLKYGHKYDSGKAKEYQHSTIDSKILILLVKRNRYRCPHCKGLTIEPLGKIKLSNGIARTENYDSLVLNRLAFSPTISSIAQDFEISCAKVITILKRNTKIGPWISSNLQKLSQGFVLGIDEKHWLKKRYHLVLTSISDKLLLALGAGRLKSTLINMLTTISKHTIPSAICIDMCATYRNAAQEVFGKDIPIIVDKFHVFAFVNRMILASKDILEYKRKRQGLMDYLLPSFRPLLYSKKNFAKSIKARNAYANLTRLEPNLKYYRNIRNMVEEMYLMQTRHEAEKQLDLIIQLCWASPCSHGIDIAKTFNRWFKEITNYFDNRYTNAYTEGLNNKLELINRNGYGYKNSENYLRRASLLVR